MAAAVAGGSAALVREHFKKHLDLATPSAALVKAALINGPDRGWRPFPRWFRCN
ncbi:MAG: hypothetical protein RQM92_16700 [Candidatus Syntrophopropionicum ammoniitolerans]